MSPYGGDKEARTPDPLLAKQVLSQLSYTPTVSRFGYAVLLKTLFRGPSKLNNNEELVSPVPAYPKINSVMLPDSLERR